MTVWDILIALSGVEDYACRYDPQVKEVTLSDPTQLPPNATVISLDEARFTRIMHAPKP